MVKCVIIEDDFSSAIDIKVKLENHGYEILCIIEDPEDIASNSMLANADIIISDIKLGDGQFSYDFLATVKNLPPIIFYSSYDDAELYKKSSKLSPYVYLIKPVSGLSLHSSIQGALKTHERIGDKDMKIVDGKVFVRSQGRLLSLVPEDIIFVKSEGNYCYIHTNVKKVIIRSSIKKVLEMLNSTLLVQVQRGYIINLSIVDSFDVTNGEVYIGENVIPVGRTYKKTLKTLLNIS